MTKDVYYECDRCGYDTLASETQIEWAVLQLTGDSYHLCDVCSNTADKCINHPLNGELGYE